MSYTRTTWVEFELSMQSENISALSKNCSEDLLSKPNKQMQVNSKKCDIELYHLVYPSKEYHDPAM
jgi:hypothetical protein